MSKLTTNQTSKDFDLYLDRVRSHKFRDASTDVGNYSNTNLVPESSI